MLWQIWRDQEGQDLIEYTLLLAFVALVAAGLFINGGASVSGIWNTTTSNLNHASAAASSAP